MSPLCGAHQHLDACCVGCEFEPTLKRLEHLEDRIRDNDTAIQGVADRVEANADDLDTLEKAYSNLDKRMDYVHGRLDRQFKDLAALRTRGEGGKRLPHGGPAEVLGGKSNLDATLIALLAHDALSRLLR